MTIRHALIGSAILAATGLAAAPEATAQENYIGEIKIFPYTFCPRGTAPADGQLLPISQYSALFSLYGTNFGGDGRTTFGLPDMRGRAPIHLGQGPGLTNRMIGQLGGQESVTLNTAEIPAHSHSAKTAASHADTANENGETQVLMTGTFEEGGESKPDAISVSNTGGTQAHNNMPPYITLRYCVALEGLYPSRN